MEPAGSQKLQSQQRETRDDILAALVNQIGIWLLRMDVISVRQNDYFRLVSLRQQLELQIAHGSCGSTSDKQAVAAAEIRHSKDCLLLCLPSRTQQLVNSSQPSLS